MRVDVCEWIFGGEIAGGDWLVPRTRHMFVETQPQPKSSSQHLKYDGLRREFKKQTKKI